MSGDTTKNQDSMPYYDLIHKYIESLLSALPRSRFGNTKRFQEDGKGNTDGIRLINSKKSARIFSLFGKLTSIEDEHYTAELMIKVGG